MNSCRFCQLILVRHFFAALRLLIFVSQQIFRCLVSRIEIALMCHVSSYFLLLLFWFSCCCFDEEDSNVTTSTSFFFEKKKSVKSANILFVCMFIVTLLYCKLCTFYAPFPVPWTACKWTNCYCYCWSFFRDWNSSQVVISLSISVQPLDSIKFLVDFLRFLRQLNHLKWFCFMAYNTLDAPNRELLICFSHQFSYKNGNALERVPFLNLIQ